MNTRRASFRLGEETERQLEELAQEAGSSRTEVLRALISAQHAQLRPVDKPKKSVEQDPAQMLLDDFFYTGGG